MKKIFGIVVIVVLIIVGYNFLKTRVGTAASPATQTQTTTTPPTTILTMPQQIQALETQLANQGVSIDKIISILNQIQAQLAQGGK
jgi:hypothetical protein